MSLGPLTYKTPSPVSNLSVDLTNSEGCGICLDGQYNVTLATAPNKVPYGTVVVGANSTDGSGIGQIAAGALEVIDAVGCVAQVKASTTGSIFAGDFVLIDTTDANGTFVSTDNQTPVAGNWIWGLALTDCAAGEQFLYRFQPYIVQYVAPTP